MKGLFLASLLFAGTAGMEDGRRYDILNRETSMFRQRHVSDERGASMIKSRRKKSQRRSSSVNDDPEVSGYFVEWFQYFFLIEDGYSLNATQFGSWYEDDVNNATRVEVVTYFDGVGYPGEYITIGDVEYAIYEDEDTEQVVCETGTPTPADDGEYEFIGYAFFVPNEEAYSIVWGPRLVLLYLDPSTDEDTESYVGVDAFTDYPVLFTNYNSTFEEVFIWSRIHEEDVFSNDFVVPDGISCTSVGAEANSGVAWHDRMTLDIARNFKISNVKQLLA